MARFFPIFNCSSAVAENQLKKMHSGDLFELSLLSKRGFELAKNTALLHKQPSFLEVVLSSTISVYYFCEDERIEWHFYGKRDAEGIDLEDSKQFTVKMHTETSGVLQKLVFAKKFGWCYGCSFTLGSARAERARVLSSRAKLEFLSKTGRNTIQDVFLFIQHVSSLFNSRTRRVDIHEPQISNLKAIQSVPELRKSEKVRIHESTVSNDEMRQIIEGFNTDSINILCKPERDFSYNSRISVKDFRTYNGSWFKGPMLLNLDCAGATIKSREVSDEDVNKFLHQWMKNTSGCGRLRVMMLIRITEKDRLPRWNLDKVTEGLENPLYCGYAFIRRYRRAMDNMLLFIKLNDEEEAVSVLCAAAWKI